MKKSNVTRLATVLCILASSLFVLCACAAPQKSFELSVMMTESDGVTVKSENPIKVAYGKSASFEIEIEKGLELIDVLCDGKSTDDYTFEDGKLTLKQIKAPVSVRPVAGDSSKKVIYEVFSTARRGGGVSPSVGRVLKGSVITFRASPNNGAIFNGWSQDKPLSEGGKLLSREEQFTMTMKANVNIYANYDDSKVPKVVKKDPKLPPVVKPDKKPQGIPEIPRNELVQIVYSANGGVCSDGSELFGTDFCIDYHEMANSLPETGEFSLSGFALVGYNTEPDGSGEYVGMGHKFPYVPDDITYLYCMWEKETPVNEFTYKLSDGENPYVIIEKFIGTEESVYIPKYIEGKAVGAIAADAFRGGSVSFVYIPSTVRLVEKGAFADCKNLTEITYFDSILSMGDACFEGSPVKKVNLHAASYPRYPDSDLSFAKKYERFAAHGDRPRLIIVSGSSKHFGFDSDYAEELLGGKFSVVNYGNNAQMNVVFYLEALSNLADTDDYILFAPEQYGPYCYTVNGNPDMTALTFQGCESCYNLVSYVDVTKYTKFFDSYTQYSSQRMRMGQKSYEARSYQIDQYGDCSISRKNYNSDKYRNGANGTFYFKADTIPVDFAANVNRILGIAQSRGVSTLLGYPPYNINACDPSTLNDEGYENYNNDMKKVINAPLISDVKNYIMQGKYFFNTDYHLMEEGAMMHTEQVVADFAAFIE